jgi:hypothetical protein
MEIKTSCKKDNDLKINVYPKEDNNFLLSEFGEDKKLTIKVQPKGDINLTLVESKGEYINLVGKYIKGSSSSGGGSGSDEDIEPRMEIIADGYQTMAFGETIHVKCLVYKGWTNITDKVIQWSVTRKSSSESSDTQWGFKDKVRNFKGEIDIAWTEEDDDLGPVSYTNPSTVFTFTAIISRSSKVENILEI